MQKTVIVTGSNGYLGHYVCRELLTQSFGVIALKFGHFASRIIDHPDITYLDCDISREIPDSSPLVSLIRDRPIVGIVNAAALLGSSDYNKNYAVNALGVKHLIDFATRHGINRFIQISSVVVLKQVKGPYGETKLIGQNFLTQSSLDFTVFIPAMVIGPESLGFDRILTNLHKFPLVVPLIGMGRQTQHPLFVLDFAKVIVKALESPISNRKVYEIAGDSVVPFRDYVSLILKLEHSRKLLIPVPVVLAKLVGYLAQKLQRVPLFTVEHVIGILQDSRLDTALVKKELGFVPTPLRDALVYCLAAINRNYGFHLKAREEEIVTLKPPDHPRVQT